MAAAAFSGGLFVHTARYQPRPERLQLAEKTRRQLTPNASAAVFLINVFLIRVHLVRQAKPD